MRGEFRFASGLVVPNNVSIAGARTILDSAFRLAPKTWFAALVSGPAAPDMTQVDFTEPTIGVNGYARIPITHDLAGWPFLSDANGHAFIESVACTFEAAGGPFDEAIQRVALMLTETKVDTGEVVSLSAPLPFESVITPDTSVLNRRFVYRLYL